jgi:hypothetical protein
MFGYLNLSDKFYLNTVKRKVTKNFINISIDIDFIEYGLYEYLIRKGNMNYHIEYLGLYFKNKY